jgi:hypothetical protein
MKQKCTTANGAVWRQAGCITADSFVGIWKFVSRPSLSEPPPERQAANPLSVSLAHRKFGRNQTFQIKKKYQ